MQPPMGDPTQHSNMAALMWQMQMAGGLAGGGAQNPMMPPMPWPPVMPPLSPLLHVRVDGLTFEYQLTEDDVRKVFSRYGDVVQVHVDAEGTTAQVQLGQPHQAVAAKHDLDKKDLAGMSGAFLRVDFVGQGPYDSMLNQMANPYGMPAIPPMPGMGGTMPGFSGMPPMQAGASPASAAGRPKKYTCKLEVGIENEGEFRVGSRVIQIARAIWQEARFQEHGGKTRLRGKGIGGQHEADEPLALCISCCDQTAFDKAVQYAEAQLQKVHNDYRSHCAEKGRPVPELSVKVSKRGSTFFNGGGGGGQTAPSLESSADIARGERPPGAPTDEEIERLIEERNEARKVANFKKADEVRATLKNLGVVLMDEKGAKGNFNGNEVTKWRFWKP
ncbi:unnamed protein product [Prorocentrum cordatum]|uniref:RRM domain-containing protein n=1 Tax=Prorocentrum cordatum TaxID=2364126 RepID=A0ABN9T510_9DINO|nr:unnamed protein product [Polarella glacialis]